MSKNLLDLSEKSEKFEGWIGVSKVIAEVAGKCGIEFFVAGALARDVIFYHGYDIPAMTFTADIDFGVRVADWEQFEDLIDGLMNTGLFDREKTYHRFLFKQNDALPLPVDIVPFGAISSQESSIAWPPKNEVRMNVLGFDEAYKHCIWVRLSRNPDFEMAFCSIAGLALMKLIAWNDGYTGNTSDSNKRLTKDSADLLLILKYYLDTGNNERLFDSEHEDILEILGDNFTHELAGARLLGRDVAQICSEQSRAVVLEILDRETNPDNRQTRLVFNMLNSPLAAGVNFDVCMNLLRELNKGVTEINARQ